MQLLSTLVRCCLHVRFTCYKGGQYSTTVVDNTDLVHSQTEVKVRGVKQSAEHDKTGNHGKSLSKAF